MTEDPNHNNDPLKDDNGMHSPHEFNENVKSGGVLSSFFLAIWYIFLGGVGIALLGFVALFVVCMV